MPRPPFTAVLFDNDGLLLDTELAWTRAEEELFRRRGRTFTPEHKRQLLGSTGAQAAAMLEGWLEAPGDGHALFAELEALVVEEAREGVPPRPGALELVERLRAAGTPMAVASNSARQFVELVLGNAGLLGEGSPFGAVVSAEEVQRGKPHPDVYLEAARRIGADPARCAALEDSPVGARAARAAGTFVIGVPYFPDGEIGDVDLRAGSLADPAVAEALGL
jgi:HAD superfamily hydrolase (TIGR01509 family)